MDEATKHVFVGQTRIVSKIHHSTVASESQRIGFMRDNTFTYHADHLGSTNWVTDDQGRGYEHFQSTPYGEPWVDEHLSTKLATMTHRFTGQELDRETGLYSFPARYYDPQTSRWMGADPAVGEYLPVAPVSDEARKHNEQLPGMGGVFDYGNLSVYHYSSNNPVRYVDPDGRSDKPGYDDVSVFYQRLYDSSLKQANDPMSVGIRDFIEREHPLLLSDLNFLMPIDGSPSRTSEYGFQALAIGGETIDRWHGGWDFGAAFGTPIRAAHSGFVRIDETLDDAFGNAVFIDLAKQFPNDRDVPFFRVTTQYSHMSSYVVSDGQFVDRGDVIGYVGNTGWGTGYHLDFRTFINGRLTDPGGFYR